MHDNTSNDTFEVQGFTPYAQIPRWILRAGKSLSHGAVRLYGVIMTYASNEEKTAFPGREKLAEDLGLRSRQVTSYIKELEAYGAIKVTRRRNRRTGGFHSNHYTVIFQKPDTPGAINCTPPSAESYTPRDAINCSITTPTTLTTPTPFGELNSHPPF